MAEYILFQSDEGEKIEFILEPAYPPRVWPFKVRASLTKIDACLIGVDVRDGAFVCSVVDSLSMTPAILREYAALLKKHEAEITQKIAEIRSYYRSRSLAAS